MNKKIIVFGLGYVGLASSLLLAQNNSVVGIDINETIINKLNNKESHLKDDYITKFLQNENIQFKAYLGNDDFLKIADYIIICTPTNFDETKQSFDTSSIESIIDKSYKLNKNCVYVIKSTLPIGFCDSIYQKYKNINLLFSPEFLREGSALRDSLNPSRIVIGTNLNNQKLIALSNKYLDLISKNCLSKNHPTYIMSFKEAESMKLFSNTYLAMRVAFFNELDNFAHKLNLSSKNIIDSICADDRIGHHYNNPSFGYGGYCLPKDTKQLNSAYKKFNVKNNLINSIIESNKTRKDYITDFILNNTEKNDVIGIYRLIMKSNSDNCRFSALSDILIRLSQKRKVILFEPNIKQNEFKNITLINNLDDFKSKSSIILTNRFNSHLEDVKNKVFTRDIYNNN